MPLRLRKAMNALPNVIPLHVRTDRASYLPGDTVAVVVRAGPCGKDLEISHLVVRLEHALRYQYRASTGHHTTTRTQTDRETADEGRFTLQGQIAAGETPELELSLQVPESPHFGATVRGSVLSSGWMIEALLGVPGSVDASAECPVHVLTPRSRYKGRTTHAPSENTSGKTEMEVRLDDASVEVGGTLSGTVVVRPLERIDSAGIRVEIGSFEEVERWEGSLDWSLGDRRDLAPAAPLAPGDALELPFELGVPVDALPSLYTPKGSVKWSVRAVVDRKLRGDLAVTREINVYDERPREDTGAGGLFSRPAGGSV